jgi:protein-S-isoprenylcysteine O-methyltransferase Ste14
MAMQRGLIAALWLIWLLYWIAAARDAKHTRRRESLASRATHLVPFALGGALLAIPRLGDTWLGGRFLPATPATYWAGAILLAAGLAFAIWARQHLAGNWSATVTLKHDHELVRSGPYGWVRHPIYTGLLLALLGTAISVGEWRALVALALFAAGVWRKLSIEERWLREAFRDQYADYCTHVPALIPSMLRARS